MIRKINRFGEISYNNNEALVTIPFIRLGTEDIETLEENYRQKIKDLEHTDSFIYADHISEIRDRLQMSYDLENCVDFHYIHKVKLDDMLPFMYSMVDLAKENVNVLWERNNMVIDLGEQKVKALVFEFDGFKVYKRDDNVDGLKELILLALTRKHSILGKPKRSDFIEQREAVFQFSEDIITSKSITEIENVISSYEREVEYEILKKENKMAEKRKSNVFYRFKERFKRKPIEVKTSSDIIKKELKNNNKNTKQQSEDTFMDKITSPTSMISIIAIVGLLFVFLSFYDSESSASSDEVDKVKLRLDEKSELLDAYRLYVTNDDTNKSKAISALEDIGYDKLPDEEKETLISWYIDQEHFAKSIKINEDTTYEITEKIIADSKDDTEKAITKLSQLESSFPNNKVLKFDIASLKNEYITVTENSDLDVYDDNRALKVIEAYVLTDQTKELKELIESYKGDEDSYNSLTRYSDRFLDQYTEKKELQHEAKELTEQIEELLEEKADTKKKKKKKEIKKEIDTVDKELEKVNDRIKEIEENLAKST